MGPKSVSACGVNWNESSRVSDSFEVLRSFFSRPIRPLWLALGGEVAALRVSAPRFLALGVFKKGRSVEATLIGRGPKKNP